MLHACRRLAHARVRYRVRDRLVLGECVMGRLVRILAWLIIIGFVLTLLFFPRLWTGL